MFESLEALTSIVSVIGSLTAGGIIGSLVGIRYLKRKEHAKAQQEVETAERMGLENTSQIVDLYKNALEDLRSMAKQSEDNYTEKLRAYQDQLSEYERLIQNYQETIKEQQLEIERLNTELVRLKLLMLESGIDPTREAVSVPKKKTPIRKRK